MNDWRRSEQPVGEAQLERDEQLATILEELVDRWNAGEQVDLEQLCAQYPELAEEIRRCAASLHFLRIVRSSADDLASRRELATGERFGDYEIVREIGRGGMGTVYEARHILLDRAVALKVLSSPSVRFEQARRRFLREARTAANLHHTNIVPIFDVGEVDGVCYYAMQLINGEPLNRVICAIRDADELRSASTQAIDASQPPQAPEQADSSESEDRSNECQRVLQRLKAFPELLAGPRTTAYYRYVALLIAQVARALDYAHRRGVIHRDIKPSNLLLDPQGLLWIGDFGLALQATQFQLDPSNSSIRELVGTPQYMSPEQVMPKNRAIDHRVDIYSLGATLYELVTLQPMVQGPNTLSILASIVSEQPPAPRQLNARVPRDLDAIIRKATAKDPQQRYATAGELADDLERFARLEPTTARPIGPVGRVIRWCRRQPLLAAVILAAVMAIGVVAGVAYRRVERERDQALAAQRSAEQAARVAESERRRAQDRLWDALYQQARATRSTLAPGRRSLSLRLLRQAAALRFSPELRDEAIAAMAATDASRLAEASFEGRLTILRYSERGDELLVAEVRRERSTVHVGSSLPLKLRPLVTLNGRVRNAAFRTDGSVVLAVARRAPWSEGEEERRRPTVHIELWDSRTGATFDLTAQHRDIRMVMIAPGGEEIVAAAPETGTIRLFSLGPEGPKLRQEFGVGCFDAITLGPDRKHQITLVDRDGKVEIWDYRTGKSESVPWGQVVAPEGRRLIRWDQTGRFLAVGGRYGTVTVWSLDRQEPLYVLSGHRGPINNLAFSPNQELLVTTSRYDMRLRVWRVTSGHELLSLRELNAPASSVQFRPDGAVLAAGSPEGRLLEWRIESATVVREYNVLAGPFVSADYGPDGRTLVVASRTGRVALVDRVSKGMLHELAVQDDGPEPKRAWYVDYLDDGRVCWQCLNGSVWVWDAEQTSGPELLIKGGRSWLFGSGHLAMPRTSMLLRAVNRALELWDCSTVPARRVAKAQLESGWVWSIAARDDLLVAAVDDREHPRLALYQIQPNQLTPLHTTALPGRPFKLGLLSPREAVVGLWDGRLLRINLRDGSYSVLAKGEGPVTALAVGPQNRRIAAAFENGSVEIWSAADNDLLYRLPMGYSGPVAQLRFSPRGDSLLVCGYYLTEWDLESIESGLRSMSLGWDHQ